MTRGAGALRDAARQQAPSTRSLVMGSLVFRWVWLLWMSALAILGTDGLIRPGLAWASIAVAALWTTWLTAVRPPFGWKVRALDLAICVWLVIVSGLVVPEGGVIAKRPFFATGYPLSAALSWGASGGIGLGLAAGAVLGFAHLMSRPVNGVALAELSLEQVQNVTGAMLNYLVAGLAVGFVWRLLNRSEQAVTRATDELLREREHSARLAERESLARAIHDSVLQSLALVHKRGKELAGLDSVPPAEVGRLAEIARKEESELRSLILRPMDTAPSGLVSLRDLLEEAGRGVESVAVEVSAAGPLWMEAHRATEVAAAVRQALENVARHSGAGRATVFSELEDGTAVVSVRDAGAGFDFDPQELARAGKVGILKSMRGRIEDLGGRMNISSTPGRGTEVEFVVPVKQGPG